MGFSVSSKIKLNMPVVKQLDKAKQQALEQTGDALLTRVKNKQVMPFDTGNLQNENTFEDCAQSWNGTVKIVSSTPYARRLYFHPEYNFSRKENIAAGGKWFSPWLEGGTRQNFCSQTFTKIYRRNTGL
nr:MAG: Minor capsid protein [Bacteriophage sp.]